MTDTLHADISNQKKSEKDTTVEIIIPVLNEENTIRDLLQSIRSVRLPVKISTLVIDGGSEDRTIEICKRENVKVINQKGKGKGNAMREAVEYSQADIVVFIDGDGTYSISHLRSMLEPLLKGEADMVVGSRLLGNMEEGSISTLNMMGNKLFNKVINIALKSHVTDSLTGYRALYRSVFKDLILFSENFEIEVEMTVEALAKGYRVVEVPINYRKRSNSKTKLSPISDGVKIAKTLFFVIMNVRPLLFFGILSAIIFGISIYPSSIVIYEKIIFDEIVHLPSAIFAALLIMAAVLFLVLGMLSELVVRTRRRIEYLITH